MRPYFVISMVLLFLAIVPNAFAQSAQVQPIMGFAWPTHSIPVSIHAPQPDAKQAVLNAMRTWNLAQQWFIETYMSGQGEPLVLYETNASFESMITVSFNQTQTTPYLGWTNIHENRDLLGDFKKITVNITIDLTKQNGERLTETEQQRLATHELGHALGLNHVTFSAGDLMSPIVKVPYPSTLNLYAVYLLSLASNVKNVPQPVSLPRNIPYMTVSETNLESVTSPATKTTTQATTMNVPPVLIETAYAPWLWIAILVDLTCIVVASITPNAKRKKDKQPF